MVYIAVTFMDIVFALLVYTFIYESRIVRLPQYLLNNEIEGYACVVFASFISLSFYSTIIHRRRISVIDVLLRVARMALVIALSLMIVVRVISGESDGIIPLGTVYLLSLFCVLLIARMAERMLLNHIRRMGHNSREVVFIGSDPANLAMYKEIVSSASIGFRVKGYYANNQMNNAPESLKYLGDRRQLMDMIRNGEVPFTADIAFTALSAVSDNEDINAIINYCDKHIIQFYLVPRFQANLSMKLSPVMIGDQTVFTNHTNNINRIDNRIVKRLMDVSISMVICLLMIPFIPIIWLIVKIQSPGPLIFSQKRTGLNGETFMCYKFRSMHVNQNADKTQATKDDPRKFPFGAFMRKTNIDELPQFFNVLRGDMSIVGPRPHMLYHTEMYSSVISKYMVRHFSKPGITGWAQVTGYRGETKELWQMEERVKRDIWYNENWSVMLDLEIISRTALQILFPDKNAY